MPLLAVLGDFAPVAGFAGDAFFVPVPAVLAKRLSSFTEAPDQQVAGRGPAVCLTFRLYRPAPLSQREDRPASR